MAQRKQSVEELIIEEWLKRPADKRTDRDLYWFSIYLQGDKPDLLKLVKPGHKVRKLRELLRDFIEPG
jgi:hypothetical protein